MISGKTIFLSPIDWGLGHASRCVPIIRELSENNKVIIGVSSLNLHFFETYFPEHQKIELPSYKISYSKFLPLWLKLIVQWPLIRSTIKKEETILKKIIAEYKIDVVISDSRYGLVNQQVNCIFITHQLHLKVPVFSWLANAINKKYIHRFHEVWVPDHNNKQLRLSGQLSDSEDIKIPVKYIGPKSALNIPDGNNSKEHYDYLVLLSGVEPQRSILEASLFAVLSNVQKKVLFIRGSESPPDRKVVRTGERHDFPLTIKTIDFLFGKELRDAIVNSETIICRSGYSTLMDLHVLNKKKLILIPTPGQTEQEYLAEYWVKNFNAKHVEQKRIIEDLKIR